MTDDVALKRLRKILGPKAHLWKRSGAVPTEAERPELLAREKEVREVLRHAKELANARHREVLAADVEYQRLRKACDVAEKEASATGLASRTYRYTAGKLSEFGFLFVEAEANTLDALFEKLAAKGKTE